MSGPSKYYHGADVTDEIVKKCEKMFGFYIYECPRFRSVEISLEEPIGQIRGRCGSGNRDEYITEIEEMKSKYNFVDSKEDSFDETYMYFDYYLDKNTWKDFCSKQIYDEDSIDQN